MKQLPRSTDLLIRSALFLPCILILVLSLRLFTLESGDLLDPTETRYATIAHNMVSSGDWVTPKLPSEEGLEPYLSKPPFHFWLTAISYSIFGIDEWSARLPSFLGLLIITASLVIFSRRFLSPEVGYLASLICITSPLMFFLGGSSTVDVTFAAFTTAALVAYAFFIFAEKPSFFPGLLVFLFSAFSFLTKGPAGLVVIGFPIVVTALYRRDLRSLFRLPWAMGLLIFFACILPWFYFLEKEAPGATSYFFITENYLRFVSSDYGGKHGAAHIRPYGSIWWMVALSMLPWLLYFLSGIKKHISTIQGLRREPLFVFVLCLAFCPLLFFTFAKSILPAYSTPAIPGLSLLLAVIFLTRKRSNSLSFINKEPLATGIPGTSIFACSLALILVGGMFIAAPQIEQQRSAAHVLEILARETKSTHPKVATISTRDLSPYWMEGSFRNELSKPIDVQHASLQDIQTGKFRHLVVRDKRLSEDGYAALNKNYEIRTSYGRWHWYKRKA
ncbi:MAG: glycosyltransferase family 39 protein [Bdellovibrionales bacterium]|nr:glycosyltransferase family 39 protein [Bdellovibrionales bacterium]